MDDVETFPGLLLLFLHTVSDQRCRRPGNEAMSYILNCLMLSSPTSFPTFCHSVIHYIFNACYCLLYSLNSHFSVLKTNHNILCRMLQKL